MEESPKVSVIVVGYSGRRYLEDCLSSVLDQELPADAYEVLYVDNHSSDGSVAYVREAFPSVQVIAFAENVGYYEAFNRVAQEVARGQYLVPLPQDTIAHRLWLSELVRVAESESDVMLCLVNSIDPSAPDYARKEREGWPEWVYLLSTTRFGQTTPKRWPFFKETVPVLAYSGVSALIKREILAVSGDLFDSSISHWLGDVELGLRVNALGYRALLVPTAVVYHVDDNKDWRDLRLHLRALEGARDHYVVYYKNMYALEFALMIPLLLIGVPLKAFAQRKGFLEQLVLFGIALPLSPLAFVLALLSLHKHAEKRREILSKRTWDRFRLLRAVTGGSIR